MSPTTSSSTTIPAGEGTAAPSTEPATLRRAGTTSLTASNGTIQRTPSHVEVGEIVLVKVDEDLRRPMIVTVCYPDGTLSGTIFCEPEDHTRPAFRGWDGGVDGRITGRPDRLLPLGYGEQLREGSKLGQWIRKPLNLPTGR